MARTSIASDAFTGTGALGGNWAQLNPLWGDMTLSSDQVISNTSTTPENAQAARWVGAGTFSDNQYAAVTYTTFGGIGSPDYGIGVVCRASADQDATRDFYFFLVQDDGTATLGKHVNGTLTTLNTGSVSWANGDIVALECDGTTISACKNETPLGGGWTVTDASLTTGKPGVCGTGQIAGNNFDSGDLTSSTTEQEGFRGRNDDGNETTATWKQAQDTDFSGPLDASARVRFLINAGGDPSAYAYQLEYKLDGGPTYIKAEPDGGGALASGTAGTVGSGGTTSVTVPYPASVAAGNLLVAVVGNRPNANTPDDISGWTKVSATGGAGSEGAGTGTIRNTIYYKEADGTESGSLTVACTSGTSMFGRMVKYAKTTGKVWAVDVKHGADSSAGTSWSATAASDNGLIAGDFLICASVVSEDTARAASEAVTATGCTFGTMSELQDSGITTGNDLGMVIADFPVSTGPSSAAAVYTMTMSGTNATNSAGSTAFIRIRQVNQPIQIYPSANITGGGEATTAQLTAPSGKSTSDFVTGRMWDDENGTDTIDITTDDYTEVEWCFRPLSSGGAANSDVYDLRVTRAGAVLSTYSVTPQFTVSSSDASTALSGSALTMGHGSAGPGTSVGL